MIHNQQFVPESRAGGLKNASLGAGSRTLGAATSEAGPKDANAVRASAGLGSGTATSEMKPPAPVRKRWRADKPLKRAQNVPDPFIETWSSSVPLLLSGEGSEDVRIEHVASLLNSSGTVPGAGTGQQLETKLVVVQAPLAAGGNA